MAEVLSVGVIAVVCTVVITTTVLIILYCICRSKDPLYDHTCVAWLHSPRTVKKRQHKYDELPLYEIQNGRKAPRQDKHRIVERLRMEEMKEKPKTREVDAKRKQFYERNPEKCPLSIDDPDFYRSESSGRSETVSREKGQEKERRDRSRENQLRSREYWEPKAKSMHDIYVNEEYYLQSHPQEYSIDKPSRSLNFIDKYDEKDGGVASSLYMHPRPSEPRRERSNHYVHPRSFETNEEGSNHSYSHSLLPRTLERDGRRGRRGERERHSSSHYVRPRSLEPERKERSHSSHYVRPRSLERDEREKKDGKERSHSSHYVRPRSLERDEREKKDGKERPHSSHYVRPRSMERDEREGKDRKERPHSSHYVRPRSMEREVKDNQVPSSHYVYPQSLKDVTDPLYVNQPPPAAKGDIRHQNKQTRSKDNMHANDNYYQNVALNNDKQFMTKSREKAPLLQATEEIAKSEVQQLSAEIPQRKESERQRDRDRLRYRQEDRDRERMRDGSERQSRPRSRSTEHRRTRSSHDLNDVGWSDHKKDRKESYFLPRAQSMISARPPKDDDSTIGRRHTIHLEFHPRSGDVTPVDSEKGSDTKKNQENRPKEPREFSPRRNTKKQDASRAQQQNYENHVPDTKRLNTAKHPEFGKEKHGFTLPSRYDSLADEHRGTDQRPRPTSEYREETFTIPPRYDSLPDRYRRAGYNTRHPRARQPTLDKHQELRPRKSIESTSSRATMESIHREIQSSSIYQTTDDGRLVLRDTSKEPSEDKGSQRPRTLEKIPRKEPSEDKGSQRPRTLEKIPRKEPNEDTRTKRERTPEKLPRKKPREDCDSRTKRERTPEMLPRKEPSKDTGIKRGRTPEKKLINGPSEIKGTQRKGVPEKKPLKEPGEDTGTQRARTPEKIPLKEPSEETGRARVTEEKLLKGPSEETETQRTKTSEKRPRKEPNEDTGAQTAKATEKTPLKEPIEDTGAQTARATEKTTLKEPIEDTGTQTARAPPKRTKSIERFFYVKSVPRSEPKLHTQAAPEASSEEIVDWNLLKLTGEKVSKDEISIQDTPQETESTPLISPNALPSNVLSDKNIDWHLFTLPGQEEDSKKNLTVNNHTEEDGPTEAGHDEVNHAITATVPKTIDWHLFTITGERIEKKTLTRGEAQLSTTSTKESIRQSLETQIKYGEDLHTPSENSLPRKPKIKPIILHFE